MMIVMPSVSYMTFTWVPHLHIHEVTDHIIVPSFSHTVADARIVIALTYTYPPIFEECFIVSAGLKGSQFGRSGMNQTHG